MPLKLSVRVDKPFKKVAAGIERRLERAAGQTAKAFSDQAKAAGRASIAAGGFGPKWQNALRTKIFPPGGQSLKPAVMVYHKIPYSGVFEEGRRIFGKPMLWLPLPNAPLGHGARRLSVSSFEKQTGQKLVLIRTLGGPPLLAAKIRTSDPASTAAKGVSLAQLRRGGGGKISKTTGKAVRSRGKVVLVPIFIGISEVNIHKKFDVIGAVRRVARGAPDIYKRALKQLEASGGR